MADEATPFRQRAEQEAAARGINLLERQTCEAMELLAMGGFMALLNSARARVHPDIAATNLAASLFVHCLNVLEVPDKAAAEDFVRFCLEARAAGEASACEAATLKTNEALQRLIAAEIALASKAAGPLDS